MTDIITALNEGSVKFSYKKSDGTVRQATGTTNTSLIPEASRAATDSNTATSEQVRYYDLDSNGWRSFNRASLDVNSIKSEAAAS